ncbi:hypothetical protein H257_16399 [Aphanomyces astaci]|uniref:Integrase zinc-binding domain-containing protein n=1 Tax=Aphanomyces astaci TaxID=112090 RepID=W4FL29_APHAT|nr:hypothetical protein H257_16399 [Aphanomyces astaci]ETV67423.1 hypothetical protein H257_16399 [Aphanomyces astaci]|eukprot:XP_009843114.1 hypothetical protein H257_16399 [Aphanomyces astaci]
MCVIAHQGVSGHRSIAATTKSVSDKFVWESLSTDIEAFVRTCLHGLCIDGESIPRPLGSVLHADKPSSLQHVGQNQVSSIDAGKADLAHLCDVHPISVSHND